jgi:hypothetical protein
MKRSARSSSPRNTGLVIALGAPGGRCAAVRHMAGRGGRYYETSFNIDIAQWGAPRSLLLNEILFMLGIPLLAMSVPIVRAARMTAREAIHDPGITAPGGGPFSPTKWLNFPGHRQRTFALRNTFRRPWRLAMILIALSAGGALFLTANNTYESLMRVVDVSLGNQGHNIQLQLQRPVGILFRA